MPQASSSSSALPLPSTPLGSPPPYSPEPPAPDTEPPILSRRAASTPHLPSPPQSPHLSHIYPQSFSSSRRSSISGLHSQIRGRLHSQSANARSETDDGDTDTAASGDDSIIHRPRPREHLRDQPREQSRSWSLREWLFGKRKGRADASERARLITTARGVVGAGETETESDDAPRNLPTARLTRSSALSTLTFSPLAESMSISIPPNIATSRQRTSLALGPLLFEFSRLLSVVPATFGTSYNVYYTLHPPNNSLCHSLEYGVCVLWAILTGWQCLQLTTGLFKRWQVYYSPLPTLIRLFALQAICWPATHLTLTFLDHEARPLICWAAIGTTTCCSRSIQMWVTSNIVEPPSPQVPVAKRRSRRKWDWNAVVWACVLPAGFVYFVMAWMFALSRESWMC